MFPTKPVSQIRSTGEPLLALIAQGLYLQLGTIVIVHGTRAWAAFDHPSHKHITVLTGESAATGIRRQVRRGSRVWFKVTYMIATIPSIRQTFPAQGL